MSADLQNKLIETLERVISFQDNLLASLTEYAKELEQKVEDLKVQLTAKDVNDVYEPWKPYGPVWSGSFDVPQTYNFTSNTDPVPEINGLEFTSGEGPSVFYSIKEPEYEQEKKET